MRLVNVYCDFLLLIFINKRILKIYLKYWMDEIDFFHNIDYLVPMYNNLIFGSVGCIVNTRA